MTRAKYILVIVMLLALGLPGVRIQAAQPSSEGGASTALHRDALRWIEALESAESGEDPGVSLEKLGKKLKKARRKIDQHLEENPKDVEALLLAARLGRSLLMVEPVGVWLDSSNLEEGLSRVAKAWRQRVEEIEKYCDRALAFDPENAEAYHWKSQLYVVRHFDIRDETWQYVDLDLAIGFARRTLELAPDDAEYREALAEVLIKGHRLEEVGKLMAGVAGGKHPISLLLSDLESVPVPEGSILWIKQTEQVVRRNIVRGWKVNYPDLRLHQYLMPVTAEEAEAFYKQIFPGFHFLAGGSQADKTKGYLQWLQRQDGRLKPTDSLDDLERLKEGISLALREFTNVEKHQPFPIEVGPVFCIMIVRNLFSY